MDFVCVVLSVTLPERGRTRFSGNADVLVGSYVNADEDVGVPGRRFRKNATPAEKFPHFNRLPHAPSSVKIEPDDSRRTRPKEQNMDDKKIRAKYGGKLAKAINRAIRAEIPGGNEAGQIHAIGGAARQSQWKDHAGRQTPEAVAYFRHKREVIDRMDAQVRKKWGVPPARGMRTGGSERKNHDGQPVQGLRRDRKNAPPLVAVKRVELIANRKAIHCMREI